MASYSLLPANLCRATPPCKKTRFSQPLQVKAQSYKDHFEEKSSSAVDAKLRMLRARIEEAKNKERLERCFVAEQGWNYATVENYRIKREEEMVREFVQLLGVTGRTFVVTLLSCSFSLCFISLLVHLNQ